MHSVRERTPVGGNALAELGDSAPKPGADLLHAVGLGSAVRRGRVHGLAGFLGERRTVVPKGLRQRGACRSRLIHPAAYGRQLKGELTGGPVVPR